MTIIDKLYSGGEELAIERTITNVPAPLIAAKFGVKNDPDDTDGQAILLLNITTSSSAAGQITDSGADGEAFLRFILSPADTALLEGPRFRHFEIKCYTATIGPGVVDSGEIRLREGVIDAVTP